MITHWTVVGYYPETNEVYVEHVTGEGLTVEAAITKAYEIEPGRIKATTIAVFRGHQDDEYRDLGMSTDELPDVRLRHPLQGEVVSHYPGDEYFANKCIKCMEEGPI